LSIYESGWDATYANNKSRLFRQKVLSKFTLKIQRHKLTLKVNKSKDKPVKIIKLPLLIPARPLKEILEKLKFFKKIHKTVEKAKPNNLLLYAQVLSCKVSKILNIKENFPTYLQKRLKISTK